MDGLGNIGVGKYTGGRGARAGNSPPNAAGAAKVGSHVTGTVSDAERRELLAHPRVQYGLTSGGDDGIIKSIDVDDYEVVTYGKNIAPEVSNVIIDTMKQCEKEGLKFPKLCQTFTRGIWGGSIHDLRR